jgi:hypothetical protein
MILIRYMLTGLGSLCCKLLLSQFLDVHTVLIVVEMHAASIIRVVVSRVGGFLSLYKFIFQKNHRASEADACLDQSNLKMGEA